MILLILMLSLFCAWLWYEGGGDRAWMRDILIPIILGSFIGIKYTWIVGFFTIGALQIIKMGYGAYDPEHDDKPSFLGKITKDRQGWKVRGIAGAIYMLFGLSVILAYKIYYHLDLEIIQKYIGYALMSGFVNMAFCYAKSKRYFIEPAVGFTTAILTLTF